MKRFGMAYVIKRLPNRDFSEVFASSERTVFMAEVRHREEPPERTLDTVSAILENFHPDEDVLIFAGPSIMCAFAFGLLLHRYGRLNIGVYTEEGYRYRRVLAGNRDFSLVNLEELQSV